MTAPPQQPGGGKFNPWRRIVDNPHFFMVLFMIIGMYMAMWLWDKAVLGLAAGTFVGVLVDEVRKQKREKDKKK